jgi:hypothetical protein
VRKHRISDKGGVPKPRLYGEGGGVQKGQGGSVMIGLLRM